MEEGTKEKEDGIVIAEDNIEMAPDEPQSSDEPAAKKNKREMADNGPKKTHEKFGRMEWEISKRLPPRYRDAKNDVYITRKTQLVAQFKKCKQLLDHKFDEVVIHALGRAINQALRLALWLEDAMRHSIKLDMVTSSVTVTDDLVSLLDADESRVRQRPVSAVHILLTRLG